jgi:hypothetical protein
MNVPWLSARMVSDSSGMEAEVALQTGYFLVACNGYVWEAVLLGETQLKKIIETAGCPYS